MHLHCIAERGGGIGLQPHDVISRDVISPDVRIRMPPRPVPPLPTFSQALNRKIFRVNDKLGAVDLCKEITRRTRSYADVLNFNSEQFELGGYLYSPGKTAQSSPQKRVA